jgi:hypothetical protein
MATQLCRRLAPNATPFAGIAPLHFEAQIREAPSLFQGLGAQLVTGTAIIDGEGDVEARPVGAKHFQLLQVLLLRVLLIKPVKLLQQRRARPQGPGIFLQPPGPASIGYRVGDQAMQKHSQPVIPAQVRARMVEMLTELIERCLLRGVQGLTKCLPDRWRGRLDLWHVASGDG